MKIPFVDLKREANFLLDEIKNETEEVIKSGIYINGEKVNKFEKSFADYCGVKHAISIGNGSDGLTFIMKSLNIGKGDQVICPANSFIASAWSIVAAGAEPLFCDVSDDLLLSIESLKKTITGSTRAVMGVHLTGKLCEVEKIIDFCKKNNLFFIEDSAQAVGASNDKEFKAGSFGIAASFSLHPLKNLSVYGDGGIVTTNNDSLAKNIRLLRNHGLANRDESLIWGYNSRLDELQAAYGLLKLKHIDQWTERYIEIAQFYSENITDKVVKPKTKINFRDVYHNYIVRVNPEFRDEIMKRLLGRGIETKIHYPIPLHKQACYTRKNNQKINLPNTEMFAKSMISLPIYPLLKKQELEFIVCSFNEIYFDICN